MSTKKKIGYILLFVVLFALVGMLYYMAYALIVADFSQKTKSIQMLVKVFIVSVSCIATFQLVRVTKLLKEGLWQQKKS